MLYVRSVLNCRSESEGGIVVDSGATSSVCGENWIAGNVDKPIYWQESSKKFRCGDGEVRNSIGSVIICVPIMVGGNMGRAVKTVHIRCDVARSNLPMLLPKAALVKMKAPIDFNSNVLWMDGKHRVQLIENSAGHVQIPVGKGKFRSIPIGKPTQIILTADEEKNQLAAAQLAKIHLQLSHGAEEVLLEVIKNAGRECSVQEVDQMYRECGCALSGSKMEKTRTNAHFAQFPGHTVFWDTVYLQEGNAHNNPSLLIVDGHIRFTVCEPLKSMKSANIIDAFEGEWAFFASRPKYLVRDGGPGFLSDVWRDYSAALDICLVTNPPGEVTQMGLAERACGILKQGIKGIIGNDPMITFKDTSAQIYYSFVYANQI